MITDRPALIATARIMRWLAIMLVALMGFQRAQAGQIDIQGPPGSEDFGRSVVVLPNGNIVVWNPNELVSMGAVYLLSPTGTVLSKLMGSSASDSIGSGGIVVLANGNFVVVSPQWNGPSGLDRGAVTWVNGDTGMSGEVSASNSLVGANTNDQIGAAGVVALTNGNYVVRTPEWNNGAIINAGAVTFGDGNGGLVGPLSSGNSLVGSNMFDRVGNVDVIPLINGNYVVCSPGWSNGLGAATFVDGSTGLSGLVTSTNSLVGSVAGDGVGSAVVALVDGDYVVQSPSWNEEHGAATWANGTTGIAGIVSASNSLVGSNFLDRVGIGGVIALTNGNYVVLSPSWSSVGAATWANGSTGRVGAVSASNSLVGSHVGDGVGGPGSIALSNGNYVVSSPDWYNGPVFHAGAATWANGVTGRVGVVSPANSLVGTIQGDGASQHLVPLANGNHVVVWGYWDNGNTADVGAVTWCGLSGCTGLVSTSNSLVGTTQGDTVGVYESGNNVYPLPNGNYVVASPFWHNGSIEAAGAATLGNGATGLIGTVSAANSLVGTHFQDQIGLIGVVALSNGSYIMGNPLWDSNTFSNAGAITLANGTLPMAGPLTSSNSLVGSAENDAIGELVKVFDGAHFAVASPYWSNGNTTNGGAVSVGHGAQPLVGQINAGNSVLGTNPRCCYSIGFDPFREQFAIGRQADNILSIRQLSIFEGDFD